MTWIPAGTPAAGVHVLTDSYSAWPTGQPRHFLQSIP